MNEPECTDLVCRARREELSRDEWRRLDRLRQTSWDVRLTEVILHELDKESVVQRCDNELAGRIVEGALRRRMTSSASGTRKSTWLLAALVLMTVGAAGAATGMLWNTRAPAPAQVSVVSASAAASAESQRDSSAASVRDSVADDARNSRSELQNSDSTADGESIHSTANEPATERAGTFRPKTGRTDVPDAKSLFAKANLLRRQGETAQAVALYRMLVQEFPSAQEVPLARLALAKLLMASSPSDAMANFKLLAQSSPALRAEGLWGMAQAARRLGQAATERHALELLLKEFPDTPYADVARQRLANADE